MNHSGGPHAEQDRETQTANGKEIDHQINSKGPRKPHLGEDTKGRYEQSNDDSKEIAASHGRDLTSASVLAITAANEAAHDLASAAIHPAAPPHQPGNSCHTQHQPRPLEFEAWPRQAQKL